MDANPQSRKTRSDAASRTPRAGACALLLVLSVGATPAEAQFARAHDSEERVLLTLEQALDEVFPGHGGVAEVTWRPTAEQRDRLQEVLGRRLYEPRYKILEVRGARGLMGWAMVTEERGKYRPITFLVGVTPDFRVRDTAIMVYRESRGGEVQRRRFLQQYRGKGSADPIRINRDIVNISGATISVRSVNAGVRKVLAVVEGWRASERRSAGPAAAGR